MFLRAKPYIHTLDIEILKLLRWKQSKIVYYSPKIGYHSPIHRKYRTSAAGYFPTVLPIVMAEAPWFYKQYAQ